MRTLLLLLLLVPAAVRAQQNPLTNQNLYDTGPTMPEHFTELSRRYAAEQPTPGGTVFLGDSITEGTDWKRLLGDSTAVNRGIGGDVTFGVLDRLDEIVRLRPARLFLLIGINDLGKDIPEEVVAGNVAQIVRRLQDGSPSTRIFVQSVLPVDPSYPGFPQHYDKQDHVQRLNRLLRLVADAARVSYVDLYEAFLDERGHLDPRLTYDGLHLNADGYRRWVETLRRLGHL